MIAERLNLFLFELLKRLRNVVSRNSSRADHGNFGKAVSVPTVLQPLLVVKDSCSVGDMHDPGLASPGLTPAAASSSAGIWPELVEAEAVWPELVEQPSSSAAQSDSRLTLALAGSAAERIQARARGHATRKDHGHRLGKARLTSSQQLELNLSLRQPAAALGSSAASSASTLRLSAPSSSTTHSTTSKQHMAALKLQCRQRSRKARREFARRQAEPLPKAGRLPRPSTESYAGAVAAAGQAAASTRQADDSPRDAWTMLEAMNAEFFDAEVTQEGVDEAATMVLVRARRDAIVAKAYRGVMAYRPERLLPLNADPTFEMCSDLSTPHCSSCRSMSFFAGDPANDGLCFHCLRLRTPTHVVKAAHESRAEEREHCRRAAVKLQARCRGKRARREAHALKVEYEASGLFMNSDRKLVRQASRRVHALFRNGSNYLERAMAMMSSGREDMVDRPGRETTRSSSRRPSESTVRSRSFSEGSLGSRRPSDSTAPLMGYPMFKDG